MQFIFRSFLITAFLPFVYHGFQYSVCAADVVNLVIVAGQSNAVGYDASPDDLPQSVDDHKILFWWRTGDPPPDDHDSSSGGVWTHLQPQPPGKPKQPKTDRQYGNFANSKGGFGPEIGFARQLYAHDQKPLAIIKVAFSGTSLTGDWNHADPGERGACYRSLISEIQKATATAQEQGIQLRPRAFAWIQGESDANSTNAPHYAQSLGDMLTALRKDLAAPGLLALIGVNTRFGNGKNAWMPTIVEQQKQLAATDPLVRYVDTSPATIANSAHFDSQGTLDVGRWFAETLLNLEATLHPDHRTLKIVTLGDSITKGVRGGVSAEQTFASVIEGRLQSQFPLSRVINIGIGGERTDQAWKRIDAVIGQRPDLVTIMYGTNDSYIDRGKTTSRITVEEYGNNLQNICAKLIRHQIKPILMTPPRWANDANPNGIGENPNVALEPYVIACRSIAERWNIPLVDHFDQWTSTVEKGGNLRSLTTDGCHPNPDGHLLLADSILPVVISASGPNLQFRTKLLSGSPVRVVCFGDSVTGVYYHSGSRRAYTDMLGLALQRISPSSKVEMINAGISGHTTTNGLDRIERDVLTHQPDLVTVMFGLNDMTRVPLAEFRANLVKIVQMCRKIGAEVVLATPNNVTDTPNRPTEKLTSYCDVIRDVGRELNVAVSDCYQTFEAIRHTSAFEWQMLMSDAIHPNMAGHRLIAEQLALTATGLPLSLDNVDPPEPALPHTVSILQNQKPLRVLAMAPLDIQLRSILEERYPEAVIHVESWNVTGMTLADIELDAKARVRQMKPDLVLISVPRSASAASTEEFKNSYAWIMNWSLNFGSPSWDCVVIHPAVIDGYQDKNVQDELIRRLVPAQDLHLIDRSAQNTLDASEIIRTWMHNALPQ